MTKTELSSVLKDTAGLALQGGIFMPETPSGIDLSPALQSMEKKLVDSLREKGNAVYGLDNPQGMDFTMALGPYAKLILVFNQRRETLPTPVTAFGTIAPDSGYLSGQLRLAFMARYGSGGFQVPWEYDPENKLTKPSTIDTYLSAVNQLGTVGNHEASRPVSVADPRHLLTAMSEFNLGSVASSQINAVDTAQRPHVGDVWEANRGMFPIISAQEMGNLQNDLVWAPFTVTRNYSRSDRLPFGVMLRPENLDIEALGRGKIVPVKANIPGSLEMIQQLGFATLLTKGNAVDNFKRSLERRVV